jgi:hypothetical protein
VVDWIHTSQVGTRGGMSELMGFSQLANQFSSQSGLCSVEVVVFTFLGAFTKVQKATIRFAMSVHPSVRMRHLGSYWMDFH